MKRNKKKNLKSKMDDVLLSKISKMIDDAKDEEDLKRAVLLYERADFMFDDDKKNHLSKDTIFRGFVQIASILIVLGYEKVDVITSKAFHLIDKGRV